MSVYFARLGELIKIGWSRDVHKRVAVLKATLIGTIPGDRAVEAAMHERFKHLRAHGEWFRIEEDLLAYIRNEAQDHVPDDSGNIQTVVRLPRSLLDRIDRLAERMTKPGFQVTRADAFRVAFFRGIEHLESRQK